MTEHGGSKTVYVEIVAAIPGRCTFDFWWKPDQSDMLRGDIKNVSKALFYDYIEDVTGRKNFHIVFVNKKDIV